MYSTGLQKTLFVPPLKAPRCTAGLSRIRPRTYSQARAPHALAQAARLLLFWPPFPSSVVMRSSTLRAEDTSSRVRRWQIA